VGLLRRDQLNAHAQIDGAGTYSMAELGHFPSVNAFLLMLLDNPGAPNPNVWYQTVLKWDKDTAEFTFTDPQVDAGLPHGINARGSLRGLPNGSFAFAMIDEASDALLYWCDKMPEDATGVWALVGTIGSGYIQVEIEFWPAVKQVLAMLLYDPGEEGDLRWYQTVGVWDEGAGQFDFEAPPVLAAAIPAAADARGALAKGASGGMVFAMIDDADDTRVFSCAKMPQDATGVWTEV